MIDHNLLVTSGCLVPGVFNSFLLNYKADYVPDDEIMMALEKENLSCLVRDSARGLLWN